MKQGIYRAPPVRRVEIPKGPGKAGTRPLGIPTAEDRLLQRAVARLLEAVFEADFLECSYGFRPGRSPHGALRALRGIIVTKKVGHLFEADIRGYFNHIQMRISFELRRFLMKMLSNLDRLNSLLRRYDLYQTWAEFCRKTGLPDPLDGR